MPLWGANLFMATGPGQTPGSVNTDRPLAIALGVINNAIGANNNLMSVTQSGTPTFNYPGGQSSSILPNAAVPYVNCFAYSNGQENWTTICFNNNLSTAEPVTLAGPGAPTGPVSETIFPDPDNVITDNNENTFLGAASSAPVVAVPAASSASGVQYSIPPASFITLTYTAGGETTLATPAFSPGTGTYTGAQAVTISFPSGAIGCVGINTTPTATTPGTCGAGGTTYTGPITVSTAETINAIATGAGNLNSAVATATYTINSPQAATPTFSPAGGTYSSTQSVTINDTTSGTTIYYTTNGTTPTTSSSVYGGPVTVSSSETLEAIAVETGYTTSAAATAAYTISSGSTSTPGNSTSINFASGQFTASSFYLNGGATVTPGGILQVTDGNYGEARSAWFATEVPVGTFTTDFTFQQVNPNADGMTFTIQGQGPAALGASGGSLGYQGIPNSVAVKFDLYNNAGEGPDSTGLYTGGASPTVPAIDLSSTGINLHSGNIIDAHLVYDGTNLTMTLTDTVTRASVVEIFPVNIPAVVGTNSAYVGFTGGTGGLAATQNVLTWSYATGTAPAVAEPAFSPAAGSYNASQSVTISDTTSGATIYYTTNGTTPTTSSSVYSGPVTVSSSQTLEAIAVETGYATSAAAKAAYTIVPVLPAPTFSPAAGSYTASQSVKINDTTAGTTIYYTTNGTTPTTSSSVYSSPVTVSSSQTLEAIAVETGYTSSAAGTAAYTISSGTPSNSTYINFGIGQFTASSFYLNGGATVTPGGILQVTDGNYGEARSAWFATEVPVGTFTTDFTFQPVDANADGMTFTIQGQGPTALGASGGSLGYQGIPNSVAVKFDLYNNAGEGSDSTGLYTGGASPTVPAIDLGPMGINLHSGDIMHAHMVYDGTKLTLTLTDTVTSASVVEIFPVNIPAVLGGTTAYVGFTGGTGGLAATQNVLTWSYTNGGAASANVSSPSLTVLANPASLAITAGRSASANILLTPNGAFSSAITFACSGLPAGASCSFSPGTVNLSAGPASTTLTINTTTTTAILSRSRSPFSPGPILAAALCLLGWRRKRDWAPLLLLIAVGLSVCTGCGAPLNLKPQVSNQPTVSTVTVSARAGTQQLTTTNLTLTLQ
jgi:hypothetical protein